MSVQKYSFALLETSNSDIIVTNQMASKQPPNSIRCQFLSRNYLRRPQLPMWPSFKIYLLVKKWLYCQMMTKMAHLPRVLDRGKNSILAARRKDKQLTGALLRLSGEYTGSPVAWLCQGGPAHRAARRNTLSRRTRTIGWLVGSGCLVPPLETSSILILRSVPPFPSFYLRRSQQVNRSSISLLLLKSSKLEAIEPG